MKKTNKSGMSLSMVLFLIFLILKLTGNITWSWWWVTCPLWIGAGLMLVTIFGAFIVGFLFFFILGIKNKIVSLLSKKQ
jgi:hypothetical protein